MTDTPLLLCPECEGPLVLVVEVVETYSLHVEDVGALGGDVEARRIQNRYLDTEAFVECRNHRHHDTDYVCYDDDGEYRIVKEKEE